MISVANSSLTRSVYRRVAGTYLLAPRRGRVHRIVENLWDLSAPYRLAYIREASEDALAAVGMEHRLLLEAIELGRTTEAELLLRRHISRVRTGLQPHAELFEEAPLTSSADPAPSAQVEGR